MGDMKNTRIIRQYKPRDLEIAGDNENIIMNVENWIEQGYTNPDHCFVYVSDLVILGVIVFAVGETGEVPILDISITSGYDSIFVELLKESKKHIQAKTFCYHLYNDSPRYEEYKKLITKAGFKITQEKYSYRYTNKEFLDDSQVKLEFRSYNEVGADAFLNGIVEVTTDTLDRADERDVKKLGEFKAARAKIEELKIFDFDERKWLLAYLNGERIGLVISQSFGEGYGGINYIGVVPSQRGKGYINQLLIKGTNILLEEDSEIIIADIDKQNTPMKNALEQVGYVFESDMVVLEYGLFPQMDL